MDENVEEFALLQNGSLLVKGPAVSGILSQGEFCLETIEDEPESMKILLCVAEQKIQHAMFLAYISRK